MKYVALVLALAVALGSCAEGKHRKVGATGTVPDAFTYQAGTTGTVIVPADTFVTSVWAVGGTGGGTVTITPSSQSTNPTCTAADAGFITLDAGDGATADGGPVFTGPCTATFPTITIPQGDVLQIGRPTLNGAANELGDGTTLVFAGTTSYLVTELKYGP